VTSPAAPSVSSGGVADLPGATASRPRIAVVANAASGSAVDEDRLRSAMAEVEAQVEWLETSAESPGTQQAADAATRGVATVIACGGDGTVRAVLEGLAGTDTALGVVPLGTGNLLAGNLGLASALDAVGDAVDGPVRRLDLGVVNGERFAVMCGVGLDAAMIDGANPALKRRVGTLAYVLAALRQARRLRSDLFRVTIETEDASWTGRTALVLVGNCGTVSGGLEVFPDAAPDDGVLDVAVVTADSVRGWLSVASRMIRSRRQRPDLVRRWRSSTVRVRLTRPRPYELDGEMRDPASVLEVHVEPGALAVHVAGTVPA
jgi:YegS/Rv2252/BmrU family lipid kinase